MEQCDIFFTAEEYISLNRNKTFLFPIFAGVLILFGIADNFGFLFVVHQVKSMHTVTNFYLANIAVADMGLLTFEALVLITATFNNPQYDVGFFPFKSNWSCTAGSIFIYTSYFGSVFFVTLVLFDRYIAICYPLKHRSIDGKRRVTWISFVLWSLSLCMAVFCIGITKHKQACIQNLDSIVIATVPVCHWYDFGYWMDRVKLTLDLGQYLGAGSFGLFMIFQIIRALSNRTATDQMFVVKTRNQVARMLIINIVVFFICYLPFKILDIDYVVGNLIGYNFLPNIHVSLGWCGRLTMLLYASLNPTLYNMTNRHYRKAYSEAFC